jgi:hypothetical protein
MIIVISEGKAERITISHTFTKKAGSPLGRARLETSGAMATGNLDTLIGQIDGISALTSVHSRTVYTQKKEKKRDVYQAEKHAENGV